MANFAPVPVVLQEGQAAPAPSHEASNLVQVVLLSYNNDGERDTAKDQYALIRLPQSYQDVITAIEHSLGEYLPGGKADAIDIFCQMLSRSNEWIWAKADGADWDLVREHLRLSQNALGIRPQNDVRHSIVTKPLFIKGPITLTFGERNAVSTSKWTPVAANLNTQMDRPESYQEAVKFIVASVTVNSYTWPATCRLLVNRPPSSFKFKFCYFVSDQSKGPNTELWVDFPESAYKDDEIWCAVVPEPRQILGFTFEQK